MSTLRRCACVLGLLLEPCVHVIALRTGVVIPHPEGVGQYVATYVANALD